MYRYTLLFVTVFFAMVSYASAVFVPFTIESQLTGDPRVGNPDGMIVDVTIVVNSANTANWTVDLSANSTDHPNIKLGEFYFNFASPGGSITFDNFDPSSWEVKSPADTVGGGGIEFLFEASDPPGQPKIDVNVSQALTFNMNTSFTLMEDYFLDASDQSCSNDEVLGCGQLGAHVQSLVAGDGESDSGFVLGYYDGTGTPDEVIPEPSTLILLGVGLVGLAAYRRKKH